MVLMNLQSRKRFPDLENELRFAGRKVVTEFGMDMYTLLYLKWITNKDLTIPSPPSFNPATVSSFSKSVSLCFVSSFASFLFRVHV